MTGYYATLYTHIHTNLREMSRSRCVIVESPDRFFVTLAASAFGSQIPGNVMNDLNSCWFLNKKTVARGVSNASAFVFRQTEVRKCG